MRRVRGADGSVNTCKINYKGCIFVFDFLRTSVCVPRVSVGDTEYNCKEIIDKIDNKSDITVFPELCVTGYTCADLFLQKKLLTGAYSALEKIAQKCEKTVFVGAPMEVGGRLFSTAVCISGGKIRAVIPKTFVPNYNEFYEKRWFSSGSDLNRKTISSSQLGFKDDYEIPIGTDIILNIGGYVTVGCEICEDAWSPLPPSTFLTLGGAEVIVNLSASNETIAKREYRRSIIQNRSASCICGYVYTSAGSDESTTDLVFSGHGMIAENGNVIGENVNLIDNDYVLTRDIDLGKIRADRQKIKTFSDAGALYAKEVREIFIPYGHEFSNGDLISVDKLPFVPGKKSDRDKRCRDIFAIQTAGLCKRLSSVRSKLTIGVSGGLDSTLALLVCVNAMKKLGRSVEDVIGITMPCFGTTDRTYKNSLALMKSLHVSAVEINIKSAVENHFSDIGQPSGKYDLTYENAQARERTQVLMDYAGRVNGLVVGTGDLSELALGWCTYNADHMSMYGVNSGIPKTLVRWMVESVAECDLFPQSRDVLRDIVATPISPELLPPDEDGKIAQKTESIVGPYALHDFFLFYAVRYGFEPEKILFLAEKAFKDDFTKEEIKKWLINFYKRFFTQQYKRSCQPDGVKVGSICLSPRGDWRMPSDASWKLWLENIN